MADNVRETPGQLEAFTVCCVNTAVQLRAADAGRMRLISGRYASLAGGRFQRKRAFDNDLVPGELEHAIARASVGEPDAVRYLYLRFEGNVYGYVRGMVRNEHDAEDVTQQVFARVMPALAAYRPRAAPFSSWLLRIAHNTAIDHMRRWIAAPAEPPQVVDVHDQHRTRELDQALRQALEELPAAQRTVMILRHIAGLSPTEIASALGTSEASVHGLHNRGRRAVRDALVRAEASPMTHAA